MEDIKPDLNEYCKTCGNNDYAEEGGRYFCNECGTELESAQQMLYESAFVEGQDLGGGLKKTTAKEKLGTGKDVLTTWEGYNLLLCGLVRDVENITTGQKLDFKLTVLQLWAAYLRHHQKAFTSKEEPKLPLFDAVIKPQNLALHNISKPKKRRRTKISKDVTTTDDRRKSRQRIQKKRDEEAVRTQASQDTSRFLDKANTTEVLSPIPITFTEGAKKILKRRMSDDHIQFHEHNPIEKCHKFLQKHVPQKYFETDELGRTLLYCLLYMALNHIGDDIQLGDMIRYIREGHITFQMKDLSDDAAAAASSFKRHVNKGLCTFPSHRHLRTASYQLLNEIDFEFKIPDMSGLCKRYVEEFCLPSDVHKMIDVLLYVCPPNMNYESRCKKAENNEAKKSYQIPNFEARAMAYIVFMLKLLFGLDDKREHLISSSSRSFNEKIDDWRFHVRQKLFVWDDWVEFIEMRKNILIECHFPTAMKSNPNSDSSTHLYLEYLSKMGDDGRDKMQPKIRRIQEIFERLGENSPKSTKTSLLFYPSLTPKLSYMGDLLSGRIDASDIFIPKCMKVRHDLCDIRSFLKPSELRSFLKQKRIELLVNKLECSENIRFTGKFHELPRKLIIDRHKYSLYDFRITDKQWMSKLNEIGLDEWINSDNHRQKTEAMNAKLSEIKENNRKAKEAKKNRRKSTMQQSTSDASQKESSVFVDMFDYLSTDDEEETTTPLQPLETITLNVSNFDHWMLGGEMKNLTHQNFLDNLKKFPKTFLWLLNKGADLIECTEMDLYIELAIIEDYFANCLKPFNEMTDELIFQRQKYNRKNSRVMY